MRALSVRQPWAWLIAHGWKPVENRNRRLSHRGPLLIHASLTFDRAGYEWVDESIFFGELPDLPLPMPDEFERGGIVGRAKLVDVVESHPSPFFFGPYGYVLEDPMPLPLHPYRGMPGLFHVPFDSALS